jgi:predicted nucleic acid-binding protein
VRLLIDTNVFLELLLAQNQADQARRVLENTASHSLHISDYSLHSIALLLLRRQQADTFRLFLSDVFSRAGVLMLALAPGDLATVVDFAQRFRLDFDDAYQLTVAEQHNLTIVSFDSDFDRTPRGRKTPAQLAV